jgi:hypothetical protein
MPFRSGHAHLGENTSCRDYGTHACAYTSTDASTDASTNAGAYASTDASTDASAYADPGSDQVDDQRTAFYALPRLLWGPHCFGDGSDQGRG